jgi:prolyl oligopeptidase
VTYPKTQTVDVVDDFHGTPVADPYRWLEDADSAETRAWVDSQNALTQEFLAASPAREALRVRLTAIWNYERYSVPFTEGGHFFYFRNDGLQNQSVLYVDGRVLLDPNTLSKDGTVALGSLAVSEEGKYLAYSLSSAGSDWQSWRVRNIETDEDLPDSLEWSKFSGASWAKDGSGFYYSRYDAPEGGAALQQVNKNQKLCFHRIGTPQSEDEIVYERPDEPDWGFSGTVSEDGSWLIIHSWVGTDPRNRVFLKNLETDGPVQPFLTGFDASYSVLGNDGATFYIQTDNGAPRGRIIAVDAAYPDRATWKTLVVEASETLQGVSLVGERFFCSYLKDATTVVTMFSLSGEPLGDVPLPGIGSAYGFSGRRSAGETYFSFTSFTTPTEIWRYAIATEEASLWKKPALDIDLSELVVEQTFVTSRDGTRVPLFLTHKKDAPKDGSNRVLLYGYGGFNVSVTPVFSISWASWLERGGVLAVACLRGGGEYGEEWHLAGTKCKKQNVFDDFLACAEWLIASGWTAPERLAISGGSNGGLLVGACLTQRPELFGACLPAVGVMDMLRFAQFTIGWAWESDYGSVKNPEEFQALFAYSPYHNLKPETVYPATLVTTSDHDDRVVPAHSYKFAARLQACQSADGPPTLIRVETDAGHGAGKPVSKSIEELADVYAFLERTLK